MNGERKLALFIDFENIARGVKEAQYKQFEIKLVLERLLEKGKIIVRRAYADWNRFTEYKRPLHEWAIELIDVPQSRYSGKNSADIRMVVDALDLAYGKTHIDSFALVSGDSDFSPLVSKLRENDRYVIGLAVKQATSPMFVKACDEFIYLQTPERSHKEPRTTPARGRSHVRDRKAATGGEVPEVAREVVSSLLARATGPLNPSFIKETLVRKQPDFDEREHGFSSFLRLLEALEKEGMLKRQQQGRQWYVVATDGATRDVEEEVEEEAIPDPED